MWRGVVINNDNQVAVPAFVGDLIDPDPPQTGETIDGGFYVFVDPGDDRSNGPPRHSHELTGRTLRCPHDEPGRHRVEVSGMAHAVSRPRNLRHGRTVQAALDSLSLGFDKHPGCACIQATPPPPACSLVIAR